VRDPNRRYYTFLLTDIVIVVVVVVVVVVVIVVIVFDRVGFVFVLVEIFAADLAATTEYSYVAQV